VSIALRSAVFGLAVTLPQAGFACAQLSQNVWMCARGTPWETATWDQFGDGATILMQDFIFDFNEDFPGQESADDLTTLEEQYTFFAAFHKDNYDDHTLLPQVIRVDTLETDHASAYRVVQRSTSLWDGHKYLETAIIAQVGTHRILLNFEGPDDMPLSVMDAETENVLSFLRDTCADPVSCAEDYEWPPTAPLKEE